MDDLEYAVDAANFVLETDGAINPLTLADGTEVPCIADERVTAIEQRFGYSELGEDSGRGALFYIRNQDGVRLKTDEKFRYNGAEWVVKRQTSDAGVQTVLLATAGAV